MRPINLHKIRSAELETPPRLSLIEHRQLAIMLLAVIRQILRAKPVRLWNIQLHIDPADTLNRRGSIHRGKQEISEQGAELEHRLRLRIQLANQLMANRENVRRRIPMAAPVRRRRNHIANITERPGLEEQIDTAR